MARDIKIDPSAWVSYVPNIDDNRSDPDPLSVDLHPMSAADVRAHQRQMGTSKGTKNFMKSAHAVIEEVFKTRVRNVKGYKLNGQAITTGSQLFEQGESMIVDDVYEALTNLSVLSEGLLGKSVPPSVSSPAETSQPPVGVANAADGGSERKTAAQHEYQIPSGGV